MEKSEVLSYGKRLAASPRFRWMPGMKMVTRDLRVVQVLQDGNLSPFPGEMAKLHSVIRYSKDHECDIRDIATRGCIMAQIRQVWKSTRFALGTRDDGSWVLALYPGDCDEPIEFRGHAEPEVLVQAMEAAPAR